jgi:hypothetical protein
MLGGMMRKVNLPKNSNFCGFANKLIKNHTHTQNNKKKNTIISVHFKLINIFFTPFVKIACQLNSHLK